MRNILFVILVTFLFLQTSAHADRGAIIPYPVKVNEEAQKAIILHNGKEEGLILGTDLQAENETEILEFIPFPSEPEVSLVNADVFKVASSLMKKYNVSFVVKLKGPGGESKTPVEIRFHKKIGTHDVTVIKVNDVSFFRNWVNKFFKKKGLPQKEKYPFIEEIVNNYVERDIKYFVFDFVKVTKEMHSVAPLAYRFKSDKIYYPLITSNSFGGGGELKLSGVLSERGVPTRLFYENFNEIDLIFITPKALFRPDYYFRYNENDKFLDLPEPVNGAKGYWNVSTFAYLPKREIKAIYPKTDEFFRHNEHLIMQFVRYRGIYNFNKDVYSDFSETNASVFP